MKRRLHSLLGLLKKDWGRPNVPGTTYIPNHLAPLDGLALKRKVSQAKEKITESSARSMENRERCINACFRVAMKVIMGVVAVIATFAILALTMWEIWIFISSPISNGQPLNITSLVMVLGSVITSVVGYALGRHSRQSTRKSLPLN